MMQASHKNGKIRNSRLPPRAHDRQEGRSIRTLTAECNPDTGQRPSDCLSAPGQTHPEDAQKSPGLREGFIEHAWWWRGKDSNLRRQCRQIYSLIPLTAREPLHGVLLIKNANRRCLLAFFETGGGPNEDRTHDLRIANAALSQLSYRPT